MKPKLTIQLTVAAIACIGLFSGCEKQEAFIRVQDRDGEVWYVKPSQVVSIEPEQNIAGYGRTNGCFARLNTQGFVIQFACDADEAARQLGVRCDRRPVCDQRPIKGHRYSTEMTVTGVGESWTNADGMVWTELKFTQKPTVATPIR